MYELNFLESYWERAKLIAKRIEMELPIITVNHKKVGEFIHTVQFKDLENWAITPNSKSDGLSALADKISNMIYMGRAKDVKPMVLKIVSGRIKKQSKPISKHDRMVNRREPQYFRYTAEFLGYGHFRWNYKAYKLNETEIKRLKEFFEIK